MWPEVEKAKSENRYELVLGGNEIRQRLKKEGLDPCIFQLTSLNYLDIHETNLETIPDDILNLSQLQTLVLHSNQLEVLNVNVCKLQKLKLLDLARNQLKEVPEEINNLDNIVSLNFNSNLLGAFPKLNNTHKLHVIDLSNNKLREFPDICSLVSLVEVKLTENEIEIMPPEIGCLTSLKSLDLGHNKIKTVPGELLDCVKLKELNLKDNPISDRRLLKLIDQCRTKQVMDYVKTHCPKSTVRAPSSKDNPKSQKQSENDEPECKHTIKVHSAQGNIRIIITESVKDIREFLLACQVNNVAFTDETFKKFLQIQNKLHDTVCGKRTSATIATHDLDKLPPGAITYTTLPPNELILQPLNRATTMTGSELFARLQNEANNLRKEKKRNTYSGIHKYLYLIEGRPKYPCLINAKGVVISFPPITNSDVSKIDLETKSMLIEVTSSVSLHACKVAIEGLLKEMVWLFNQNLDLTQIKTGDSEGNLKVTYPAKNDLALKEYGIRVIRE